MKFMKRLHSIVLALALFCLPVCGQTKSTPTVALKKSWVLKYKDRATVTTTFNVDRYPKAPHSVAEDGDIHVAGRDSVAKLPLVVEIMNPRYLQTLQVSRDIMKALKETTSGQAVQLSGAWRLWFEHPSKEAEVQGKPVSIPENTNPDHIFEVHPVTSFGDFDLLETLVPIRAYKKNFTGELSELKIYESSKGRQAFTYYESIDATIKASQTAIMIASKKAKYNYAEFVVELAGKPKEFEDCFMVMAHVYDPADTNERLTAKPLRMVFIKGSPPAIELEKGKHSKGDFLHLVGIPRVNLDLVNAVATKSNGKEQFVKLPYEMIIVAVLEAEEEE